MQSNSSCNWTNCAMSSLRDRSYVIVIYTGQELERVDQEGLTLRQACSRVDDYADELGASVMRRLDNGQLTTEF